MSFKYDGCGNCTVSNEEGYTIGDINPLRYRRYYYDVETGYYYLNSRYYDSNVGRFINADDTSNLGANVDYNSINLFVYCSNNPINRMDNTGESWVAKFYLNLAHNMFLYLLECAITQEPPTISDLMGVFAYSVMGTIQNISKELLVLVNGSIAVIVSILNGESLSAAVCNGLIAATLTMTTFGFTNKYFNFAKKDDDLSLIIADTIFDYAKTTIVSAISRATSSKAKDKSNEKDVSTGLKGDNRKRTFSMLPGARNMLDRYSYDYWRWC